MDNFNGKKIKIFAVDAENLQHLIQGYVVPLGSDGKVGIICDVKDVTSVEILKAVECGIAFREKDQRDKEDDLMDSFVNP
jgi:hypothetical protein